MTAGSLFSINFCSSKVEVMQDNSSISFVKILYELWRKTNFSIFGNVMTKFFNVAYSISVECTGFRWIALEQFPLPPGPSCHASWINSFKTFDDTWYLKFNLHIQGGPLFLSSPCFPCARIQKESQSPELAIPKMVESRNYHPKKWQSPVLSSQWKGGKLWTQPLFGGGKLCTQLFFLDSGKKGVARTVGCTVWSKSIIYSSHSSHLSSDVPSSTPLSFSHSVEPRVQGILQGLQKWLNS